MGYSFIPDDLKDLCDWVQTRWDPNKPQRANVLVQMMRDAYKSTSITQSLPSFLLHNNPNLSILIVSKRSANAQSFLDVQRKRFESEEFTEIFGHWKTDNQKWDSEKIFIRPRNSHRKEPSIMCAGINTALTSLHFDVIIIDDPTGPEDMYSQAEREQTDRFYKSSFDLLDKKHGLLLVIGTCWHEEDVIEKIKKKNKEMVRQKLMPFQIYHRPAYFEGKEPVEYNFSWVGERWLNQIREDKADIRDFSANYLLKPLPDAYKIFNISKLHTFSISEIKPTVIVMFVDPSLSDTKKSDYSAIVAVGALKGKLYLLKVDMEQRKPSKLINDIGDMYESLQREYPDAEIFAYMETVAFQQFLKDEAVNQLCAEGIYVPLENYPQNKNKISRITAMEKYLSSGIVSFRNDWEMLDGYKLLMSQLDQFPMGAHDDGPDALEGAVSVCMEIT